MEALLLGHLDPASMRGGGERYISALADAFASRADVAYATPGDLAGLDLARFDVVHVTASIPTLLRRVKRARRPRLAVTFHGAPLTLIAHGWRTGRGGVYRLGQAAVYAWELARSTRMLAAADAVVPVSHATADALRKQYPWGAGKLYLNENGVDTRVFNAVDARDDGFVLFVGRLEASKGVDRLVRALSGTSHRLVVAGTGSLDEALRAQAGPNITFEGEVSEERLLDLYRRASAAVFPSLYEGYGLVALESLACGTPTVVSDAFAVEGPAAELLEWFPVGDDEAMRAALDRVVGLKDAAWSRKAFETVDRHHSTRRQAEGLLRLYEALAAGERVPASPDARRGAGAP